MRKKHTYKYVKNYFDEQGCELLEKKYIGCGVKMQYKCNCGNISSISLSNFQQGKRCRKCSECEKHTYEYVKNYFDEQGCELLEKKYKNNAHPMKYKCDCGNISTITLSGLKSGSRCQKCSGNEKLTLEYVNNYFTTNNCALLETKYINNNTKMKYICSCGQKSIIPFYHFQQGQRCMKCSGSEKLTYEYVNNYFKEQKCKLLETEYKNNNTLMKYICSCGNISQIRFNNFEQRKRCRKCGSKKISEIKKYSFKYVYNYFKEQGCKLIEKEYKSNRTLMKYKCNCGEIGEITFGHFKQGRRCRKCSIQKHSGKNHWNYNPNITDEERKLGRFYPDYVIWRNEIYKRDDYTCKKCNQRGGKLNAHHIINYATNKELRTDRDNGITMCKKCHIKFHKIYGKINNNRQQLDEFLLNSIL